jgi:hypothetical protein
MLMQSSCSPFERNNQGKGIMEGYLSAAEPGER